MNRENEILKSPSKKPRLSRSNLEPRTRPRPELKYRPNETIDIENNFMIEIGHYEKPWGENHNQIRRNRMLSPHGKSNLVPKMRGNKFNEGSYHKAGKNVSRPYSKTFREDCDRELMARGEMRSIRDALTCLATMVSSLQQRILYDLRLESVDEKHFQYNINMWERIQDFYERIKREFIPRNLTNKEARQVRNKMYKVVDTILDDKYWRDWFPKQLDLLKTRIRPQFNRRPNRKPYQPPLHRPRVNYNRVPLQPLQPSQVSYGRPQQNSRSVKRTLQYES